MIQLQSHVFCTSVKCAAVVYVFGGELRRPDPVTIELLPDGSENLKFWFLAGSPTQGFAVGDIISAYSILSRGIPTGIYPRKETLAILEDKTHPIHACFNVLSERDRLHRMFLDSDKGSSSEQPPGTFATTQTKLAACLSALGFKNTGFSWDGKNAAFYFIDSPEIQAIAEAYNVAWNIMLLEKTHPLYWMKSVLDRRDELLRVKRGEAVDVNGRKIEPHYREDRGMKTTFTPIHASKSDIEKSKKYINA